MFERRFIVDSYANRIGKGTHRAVNRLQQLAQRYRYVLRMGIVKHFPSIDHAILHDTLARFHPLPDPPGVKARNVRHFERRLHGRWQDYRAGLISFAEFNPGVQDWRLREHILGRPLCLSEPTTH